MLAYNVVSDGFFENVVMLYYFLFYFSFKAVRNYDRCEFI